MDLSQLCSSKIHLIELVSTHSPKVPSPNVCIRSQPSMNGSCFEGEELAAILAPSTIWSMLLPWWSSCKAACDINLVSPTRHEVCTQTPTKEFPSATAWPSSPAQLCLEKLRAKH